MIFNQGRTGRTVLILLSFGIAYLFMIYSYGRDEGKGKSSSPPIKTSDSRQIAGSDFGENVSLKGILFSTDVCWNRC